MNKLKAGVFVLISTLILKGSAQVPVTGWNGAGFFDVYPPQVAGWMGSDYVLRYRADKNIGINFTELQLLIELDRPIIYCAGLINTTAQENISAIQYLIDSDVNIISIELGNEPYNQKECNFDFNCYKTEFEPFVETAKIKWPDMPISYFAAPRPSEAGILAGNPHHKRWNDDLREYMETFAEPEDQISIHIYFNINEIPILKDTFLIEKRAFDIDTYYPDLDFFYTELFYEGYENMGLWDSTLNYLHEEFSTWMINISEFGIATESKYDVPGGIKNTIAYHALMSALWNKYKHYPQIKTMLEHNGNAPGAAGCITPAGNHDLNPNGYESLRRLALYTYSMQSMFPEQSYPADYFINSAGGYQFHFANMAAFGGYMQMNYDTSLYFISGSATYISGMNSYSSSGTCSFMGPETIENYEITGMQTVQFAAINEIYLPPWSYGYITVTFEKKVYPEPCPERCKYIRWAFWHWKKCKPCFE